MKQKTVLWMKQSFLFGMMGLLFAGMISCKDKEEPIKIFQLTVKLIYPGTYQPEAGLKVKLENTVTNMVVEAPTNGSGIAVFETTAGTYNVSVSESRVVELTHVVFNGVVTNLILADNRMVDVPLIESKISQIVIKEFYHGGCQRNDGSGAFYNDKYIVLYNNSGEPATLVNGCFGFLMPYNSNGNNNDLVNGSLVYESQGYIPAAQGFWAFKQPVTIDPGKQIVVAFENAIDNTQVYTNSINFNNSAYYCAYDPESGFNMASYYPPPAPAIPTNHYLKGYRYGSATAWSISQTSPAFFLFTVKGITPQQLMDNPTYVHNYGGSTTTANACRKVSKDWVVDAVEIYAYGNASNGKRFPAAVDAGYVELRNQYGFTVYRNVDKAATEAIEGNAGKIVYNYALGTQNYTLPDGSVINGTTDPSGIDAEASLKNGARIVYKNTNNSSNDFHMRRKASLKN